MWMKKQIYKHFLAHFFNRLCHSAICLSLCLFMHMRVVSTWMVCNLSFYLPLCAKAENRNSSFSRSTLLLSEDLHRVSRLSVSDPILNGCEKSSDKLLGFWLSWYKFNLRLLKCEMFILYLRMYCTILGYFVVSLILVVYQN